MTNLIMSAEDWVKSEWNVVRAWVALHQTVTVIGVFVLGLLTGALWF